MNNKPLADLANLPLTGRGAFVLDGTKRFYDKNQGRTVQKDAEARPRRACIRNSVELARYRYTLGCIGCEAAMTQEPSRDHTEQCRTRIIQAMSSDVAFSAHERMSRPFSNAKPNLNKGEIC